MNVHDLKQIYRDGLISNSPNKDKTYFNYFDGVQYLHIAKNNLNTKELVLLDSMMSQNSSQSEWYDFLVKGVSSIPEIEDSAQCIHFNVKKISRNKKQWLASFQSFFDNVYDLFFLNDEHGVLVLESWDKSSEELEGFLSILDDDFSTSTSVFVGLITHKDTLREVFKEEQALFNNNMKTGKVINYLDSFIPYYIAPQLNKSIVGQEIRKTLEKDTELVALVQSLWKNQGNLSAAAQELYIHRNTINYRMDKLHNEHSLNLRNMQQLLLCYLLTI